MTNIKYIIKFKKLLLFLYILMNFFLINYLNLYQEKIPLLFIKIDLIFMKCYYIMVYFYNKNGG